MLELLQRLQTQSDAIAATCLVTGLSSSMNLKQRISEVSHVEYQMATRSAMTHLTPLYGPPDRRYFDAFWPLML